MTLAIIGGMGPEATLSFLNDFHDETRAIIHPNTDQDYFSYLLACDPGVPNRTDALTGQGPSPVPAISATIHRLQDAGASMFAIPCNTTHAWYPVLAAQAHPIEIIHIVDAVRSILSERGWGENALALLATEGAILARVYQDRLPGGDRLILPTTDELAALVMPGIAAIKASDYHRGYRLLAEAEANLRNRGADVIIHGCTEIPIVLPESDGTIRRVSSTRALARRCVQRLKLT